MPSTSKKQQRLMGWVHACQTGQTKNCPKRIKKIAKGISKKASRDFAKSRVGESIQDVDSVLESNDPLTFKRFLELLH